MGNYRFKLSELIPNAWFYKLRDMGKSRKKQQNISVSPSPINKHQTVPTARSPRLPPPPRRSSSYYARPAPSHTPRKSASNRVRHRGTTVESFSPEFRSDQLLIPDESSTPPELHLRPIITKPTSVRKTAVRLKLRSPRISTRTSAATVRSRAVVKSSVDPRRDFKESMEEMIAENNIRGSKDLEELLACYLCLNSDEYHHIIINVFKQIWLDLNLTTSK